MPPYAIPLRLTLLAGALAVALPGYARQVDAAKTEPVPAPAPAVKAPLKAEAPATMQKVEVRGTADAYDPRRDDTASKIVVNHEEIIKYGDNNVMDVLKRLPGVTVSGANVRMRGLGNGYTQVLINGERAPAGFSIDSLAPDVIERIEVLRAASAEFSTQSIAGTINIVLKKAIKNAQRELKVGGGKGTDYKGANANLQMSDRAGALSYSLSINAFYNKYDRGSIARDEGSTPAGVINLVRRTDEHSDGDFGAVNVAPRLNWTLAGGDTVTVQGYGNATTAKFRNHESISTQVGPAPQYAETSTPTHFHNEFGRVDVNWVHKYDDGAKLDLKLGASDSDSFNHMQKLGRAPSGALNYDSTVEIGSNEKGLSYTAKYATAASNGHAFSSGIDGGTTRRTDARTQREVALVGAFPVNSDEDFDADVTRFSAYAQDEWSVTKAWSMYLGVRWEGIRTRSAGNTFATSTSDSAVWSPIMQTLYKLPDAKGDQVRLALTRTYKAPSTQSLVPRRFTSINNSPPEPDYQGNPNLKPELAFGVDASFEHFWSEGALLSVSTSMRRISNYTRNRVVLDAGGRYVSMPLNDGNAITRGLELEAKFPLKAVMDKALPIDVRASLSRNWSRVEGVPGPDNRLDGQTPLSATLGIDYKEGALTTGSTLVFRNGGPVRVSINQTSYQNVRRELDAYALWKFDPKLGLRISFNNLLRQDNVFASSYATDSGVLRRSAVAPSGVTVRATLEMKF
jgi:outer membrane receptor for ferrienterochelin and colicins